MLKGNTHDPLVLYDWTSAVTGINGSIGLNRQMGIDT